MRVGELVAPLRERAFRWLFLARSTSIVGDQIAPIAVTFAVLDLTGSASDLGLALAARTLAFVVFVLIGGVWADRVSRYRLMMASDVGRFLSQGLLAVLLIAGVAEVWEVVLLQGVNGAATAFFRPAANGLTPATVSPANLQRANSLLTFTDSAAQIFGPALAGVLIVLAGPGWGIMADAATFAVSALFLAQLRLPKGGAAPAGASFISDLRTGWHEVRSRTWLWVMIVLGALFQVLVLATFMVLGPVVADRDLGGAGAWSLISGAMGVGAVLGAVGGMRFRFSRPLVASNLTITLTALPMLLLAGGASTWAVAVAAIGAGYGMSFFAIIYETTLQEQIPDEVLSRVASYDWMGSTALRPLGLAAVGPIAVAVGVGTTLSVSAVAIVALLVGSLAIPAVRQLRVVDPEHHDPPLESAPAIPDGELMQVAPSIESR
jgi:MFS family permease